MSQRSEPEAPGGAQSASGAPRPDQPTPLLGNLTPAQFMRRYWQKKPLLIRQAIPGIVPPLTREALFELAADMDAESRLITHFRNRWQLDHGPFEARALPSVNKREWTLLVQGADLHDDAARALLERFRFVPDARLDDLMISYATDGGGVGPHFDSYDVFLLQVHGKRRWRIGAQTDLSLREDLPLKVLENFAPTEEWVLEPGDMLYLPPHIAHDGIAEGECMTCSIGFRAPSAGELTGQFLYYLAERGALRHGARADALYRDPRQPAVDRPAQLPAAMVEKVEAVLNGIRWTPREIESFLGSYLSEPKSNVVFDAPDDPLDEDDFAAEAGRLGVRLDRKAALMYNARSYFINGEENPLSGTAKWLPELADRRCLGAKRFVTHSRHPLMTALLHEWYCAGWIKLG
ncbi:cupin domain-containing protein [Burkholderia sp. Ac-20379]|uniref:cupin domain-containing protein n=1 Tax=Burkholderia sp. Ac-20379 TaxID=2703900 RepID=UPI00197D66C1|nr:cupin domain-containing protein [Burkholderia sp. Ac-20379]MBN3727887.1 cupin domain-containing protein [Burkholderia sp. Ac-20379]